MTIQEAIERYPEMTPRERTIAVGVHIFGWKVRNESIWDDTSVDFYEHDIREPGLAKRKDWADTWAGTGAIIDHMRAEGWHIGTDHRDDNSCVTIGHTGSSGTMVIEHVEFAPTIHEAVAIAALRATAAQREEA